jgi:hypothetical protein
LRAPRCQGSQHTPPPMRTCSFFLRLLRSFGLFIASQSSSFFVFLLSVVFGGVVCHSLFPLSFSCLVKKNPLFFASFVFLVVLVVFFFACPGDCCTASSPGSVLCVFFFVGETVRWSNFFFFALRVCTSYLFSLCCRINVVRLHLCTRPSPPPLPLFSPFRGTRLHVFVTTRNQSICGADIFFFLVFFARRT